jgi:hypothetical protein
MALPFHVYAWVAPDQAYSTMSQIGRQNTDGAPDGEFIANILSAQSRSSILLANHVSRGAGPAGYVQNLWPTDTAENFVATIVDGPTMNIVQDYVTAMHQDIKDRGAAQPDYIILDQEIGYGPASPSDQALWQALWDDTDGNAALPKDIREHIIANETPGAEGAFFVTQADRGTPDSHWDMIRNWVSPMVAKGHYDAMIAPALTVWGDSTISSSDYIHTNNGFKIFDVWGDIRTRNSRMGTHGSPNLYPFTVGGSGTRINNGVKAVPWRRFCEHMNYLRASIKSGTPTIPWIYSPSGQVSLPYNRNPWIWRETCLHCRHAGAKGFLFFNTDAGASYASPGNLTYAADMAYAHAVFLECEAITPSDTLLDEITDLDADEVNTGSYRTTYTDYLANGV